MPKLHNWIASLREWSNHNQGILALVAVFIAALPWIIQGLASLFKTAPEAIEVIQPYKMVFVWVGILLFAFALFKKVQSLDKRLSNLQSDVQTFALPEVLLDQKKSANLSNWTYHLKGSSHDPPPWSVDDKDVLTLSGTAIGGFYRGGATWEDYDFVFEFNIINKCAGWIVRAQPFRQFLMVQFRKDMIRPHQFGLRVRAKEIDTPPDSEAEREDMQFIFGFHPPLEIPHNVLLREWNEALTEVRQHSITVKVDGQTVWTDSDILAEYPVGTVGLRCWGDEKARFRNIRVLRAT